METPGRFAGSILVPTGDFAVSLYSLVSDVNLPPESDWGQVERPESDPNSHSFIVKFWLEEAGVYPFPSIWRGHVTHVPDGARCYLSDVDGIVSFISPYLHDSWEDDGGT